MDEIELQVARAVTRAHLAEKVLHGRGQWGMGLNTAKDSLVVLATHFFNDETVGLTATFPAHHWLDRGPALLCLHYEGDVLAVREVRHPGDGNFVATWEFTVGSVEAVA